MIRIRPEGASQHLELSIESDPANVARARREIETLAAACGFDEASRGEIGLCVNEAVANVIRHAYHGAPDRPILISAELNGETLRISVRDWGTGVNPAELPARHYDPLKPGGVGMLCLRQLMDEVSFVPQDDGMLLMMSRNRTRTSAEPARDME